MGGASLLPSGRVYAIGPVHGCFDLLDRLISQIRADVATRPSLPTRIVFLGGLVNRGRQSAEVVTRLRRFARISGNLIVLKGSDEQLMTQSLGGDLDKLEAWLCRGGGETLTSWGVAARLIDGALPELLKAARAAISKDTRRWLAALPTHHRDGNYFFAHAGIRPGVPLAEQSEEDLLWIGREFLNHNEPLEAVIVHGQAPDDEPVLSPDRIALTNGGWWSGRLSAVGLEGSDRWLVAT